MMTSDTNALSDGSNIHRSRLSTTGSAFEDAQIIPAFDGASNILFNEWQVDKNSMGRSGRGRSSIFASSPSSSLPLDLMFKTNDDNNSSFGVQIRSI